METASQARFRHLCLSWLKNGTLMESSFRCSGLHLQQIIKDNFEMDWSNLPVLIDFSRSPGLSSFSSGIFCCLSWNNIWFGRYFIHHTKRILLTYWVTRTIKSTWKTRSLENIQLSITASYSGIHFVDISIYSIYCTISNWPSNRPAVMQLFHINNLRFLLRF